MSHTILYKYIYRLMAVLLVFLLVFSMVPAAYAAEASGTCGGNLSWSLDAGTLTITGSGNMDNFHESTMAPWYPYRNEIQRVILPEGLTSIGNLAFYECKNLSSVVIPGSVKTIGSFAFAYCKKLEMLDLGSSVTSIGESAFSDCYTLKALRLPGTVQTIGMKAFYRCESITTVTVPASVTYLGQQVFGYCKKLVSADIQARISAVPEWLFYRCEALATVTLPDTVEDLGDYVFRGCDNLGTVYYDGESKTPEQIQEEIGSDVPGFDNTGYVTEGEAPEENRSGTTTENEDGTITQENTTVTESEDVTVSTTVTTTHPEDSLTGETKVEVNVTVETEDGWEEAISQVEDALRDYSEHAATSGSQATTPQINVYIKGTETVDPDFIDAMAGRDVILVIRMPDGSIWRLLGKDLDTTKVSTEYNLSYSVTTGSQELCQELEVNSCYVLKFHNAAQINAELLIELGDTVSNQQATLFQRDGTLSQLQTVMIDQNGCIHFYLASVTNEIEYYVALNLPEPEEEAIVPKELQSSYGIPEDYVPVQYRITGRTSSWGIGIDAVTWIMIGGFVVVVAAVGILMFMLNKRKLKRGYIPEIDEEDLYEEEK